MVTVSITICCSNSAPDPASCHSAKVRRMNTEILCPGPQPRRYERRSLLIKRDFPAARCMQTGFFGALIDKTGCLCQVRGYGYRPVQTLSIFFRSFNISEDAADAISLIHLCRKGFD